MNDPSSLKRAYEKNPIAFLLFQVVLREGRPSGLKPLYANPAALSREEYAGEKLARIAFQKLDPDWLCGICDAEPDVPGMTLYDDEGALGFYLDCFPCGRALCGCVIRERHGKEHRNEEAPDGQNWDTLTGALNFEGFKREAVRQMKQRPERCYAVWYCDIRRFQYINDVFGYQVGDQLLCRWAEAIRADLREGERFGRIAGDHVAILTWYIKPEELERRFLDMVDLVKHELNGLGQCFEVEIKAGVYRLKPGEAEQPNINQMLDWANVAQKSVKALSGSQMAFFTEELWKRQLRELEISQHVHAGIEAGEFSILFQPQYDYLRDCLCGAEVLAQWNHPSLGLLSPAEFIPILEREGQITALDWYIWEEACRAMRRWLDRGNARTTLPLSVNMSRVDIWEEGLCERLCGLLRRYDLTPEMLRLEITESAYMEEPERIIVVARQLRERGFTVEMDDFGSGYSSLNMLKDVPVDILKLDMNFLSGADNTFRSGNILSSVIRMAHWLELPVIAEGVENRQQADYLKSLGCSIMQGYYFARPMPEAEFEGWLNRLPKGSMERLYPNLGLRNMAEFLDTESKSSFLFTRCIGGGALLEYNGDNTEALMVNDAFCDVFGLERQQFERDRRYTLDLIALEDRPAVRRAVEEAVETGSSICVVRTAGSSGEQRWVRIRHQWLSSNLQLHILFALVEDVTVQCQTRKKLDEVTEEFRSYLDLVPGGVVRYAMEEDGGIAFVSRGLMEMLGCTSEQFQTRFHDRFWELVWPEDRARVREAFRGPDKDPKYCEYRIPMANGSWKWVYHVQRVVTDAEGKRWCYAVITDIDGQKQAESAKLFETFGKAITGVFDEVTDFDYKNDVAVLLHSRFNPKRVGVPFHNVNQALEWCTEKWKMDGLNRERYFRFVHPDHVKELYLSGRIDNTDFLDGKMEWYKSLLLPLSETRCLFCTCSITDQKRAELQREESARLSVIQDLLDQMPVGAGVFELDAGGHWKLRFLSQAGCRILRVTAERAREFFEGPDAEAHIPCLQDPMRLQQLLDSGEPQQRRVTFHRQGAVYSVDMITNLVRGPNGTITGYLAILDATDQVRAEQTQQWQRSLYRILAELPHLVAYDYDPKEDRMTRCVSLEENNGRELVIDGYMDHLERQRHIAPEDIDSLRETLRTALRGPASGTADYRADYFGEGLHWCRTHYTSLADEDGQVYRVVGRVTDIEEEVRREQALRELAQRDAMTGLLNHDASERAIEAAIREYDGGALFIMDIDDFKRVNDVLGHLFGDTFLQKVAENIRPLFRSMDVVGRFGGDEFIAFMPGVYNAQVVGHIAADVVRAVEAIAVPELAQIRCSVGVAIGNSGSLSLHELFTRADFALYEAKHGGKGSYAIFQGEQKVYRMPEVEARAEVPETILDSRPRMLAGDVFEILYHTGGTEEGIQEALGYVGRWMKVSRCYIFEIAPGENFCVNTFEWCGEGATRQKEQLQHVLLSGEGGSLYDNFNAEGVFYCPDVRTLPQWQQDILEPQGIGAMLQWAFRWKGELRGFVGFDMCGETCPWIKEQVDSLVRAAEVITVFLRLLREKDRSERTEGRNSASET